MQIRYRLQFLFLFFLSHKTLPVLASAPLLLCAIAPRLCFAHLRLCSSLCAALLCALHLVSAGTQRLVSAGALLSSLVLSLVSALLSAGVLLPSLPALFSSLLRFCLISASATPLTRRVALYTRIAVPNFL